MNFRELFHKKSTEPVEDDTAPAGLDEEPSWIMGSLKTSGANAASGLRKKPIVLALAGVVAVMGGLGYVGYEYLSAGGSGSSSNAVKVRPSARAQQFNVPRIPKPVAPVISAPAATAVSTPTSAAPAPAAAPAPNYAAANKAQEKQLTAMIAGSGASTASWSTGKNGASAPNPAKVATPLPKPKTSVYSAHLVRKEVSPYELLQGTVIQAVLETGIKSDLPGMITAVVNQPVYSSVSGAYVLIPAGSKLIGMYQSKLIAGATRVGVIWNRILFPNGTYMQIGKSEGYSPQGYAGFHDEVNDHTWAIFKNALLLSLIDVGMSVASPTSTSSNTTGVTGNAALQDGEQSLAQTFGQAEAQMFQKDMSIAPTLTIRTGYAFNVIVSKDLVFPGPYQRGTQLENQTPTSAAMPTMASPYGQ